MISRQLKVGIFVAVGLVLVMISVFMIGENRRFWESKVDYVAPFQNVAGLNKGSPVRMGGVDIGTVTGVSYSSESGDIHIYVELAVVKREAPRIRKKTVARIVAKGLLGDKMVELSVPSEPSEAVPPGGTLTTEEPSDMFGKLDDLSDKAKRTLDNVEKATGPLANPELAEDLKGTVKSLREILDGVAHNDSAAHRLLLDPREGEKIDRALTNLDKATERLAAAMGEVQGMSEQVRTGPGIAHALLYDGEMSKNAAGALDEVHKDLTAIREGNGIAHALLYGDDNTQHVMGNLNAVSDDVRAIVAGVRAGKGTIGALLVDPSVYEDIKAAVGNVERNQVLRALVRYSIKADEAKPEVEVTPRPQR